MRLAAAVAVAMGGALACTAPMGECGPGGSCPQGQRCSVRYNICYQSEAPQVSWASPQVGETLVGLAATVSGIISSGGQYTAEISIGRPDQWQPLGVSAAGQFSAPLSLPASDGEPQPLRVRTTEPEAAGGRVTVSSIYRAVDNVPPSLSFSEPALRPVPAAVRLVASEPMSSSAAAPAAAPVDGDAPPLAGQWNADRTEVRFEGLAHDATYAVSIPAGGLADRAGNPTQAPFSVTFTTGPASPPSDATIPIGSLDLTDLEAASDAEGAVSVVLASAQGLVVWGEFDARTALFRPLSQAVGTGLLGFQAISAPVPDQRWPDGTSRRAAGVMLSRAAAGFVVPSLLYEDVYAPDAGRGTFASVNPGGLSYLPGPGRCGQPPAPATLEVDPSTGQMVLREGAQAPSPVSLPAAPAWTLFQSATSGEWVTYDGGSIFRSVRSCACSPTPACSVGPAQSVTSAVPSGARISAAGTPNDDRVYVYDTSAGRTLTCLRGCDGGTCGPPVGTETEPQSTDMSVASANQGSFILEAQRSGGFIVLYRRDLQQGCGAGPSPAQEVGRLNASSSVRRFRPVMFGRRPGLVYISTAGGPGVLRTYLP